MNFIFSVYLLVFVVSSGQLYPLLSDSKSDSEPDKLEREGGGGGYGISPLFTSSNEGRGQEKIFHHQGG